MKKLNTFAIVTYVWYCWLAIYVYKLITNYQLLLITHICVLYIDKWICATYYVKLLQERYGL